MALRGERQGNGRAWACAGRHPEQLPAEALLVLYLEVLFDPLLIEALGQDHHSPLQLVAQGNLGWSSPVLFSNGIEYWVLQEPWFVLDHPGREAEKLQV